MAGEMLGLKLMYLDAGSGARRPVRPEMIKAVKEAVSAPLIVGGGIRSPEAAQRALEAGADCIVVGNGLEENASWLPALSAVVHGRETQVSL